MSERQVLRSEPLRPVEAPSVPVKTLRTGEATCAAVTAVL